MILSPPGTILPIQDAKREMGPLPPIDPNYGEIAVLHNPSAGTAFYCSTHGADNLQTEEEVTTEFKVVCYVDTELEALRHIGKCLQVDIT